ncbi:hypothetical protein BKA62DRAFT_812105 [Auriculariales sp. MPI-PUGE-AT-0066]|nr:hypothetical protein BKA62DRAFT_812105 [Auriculariales sp. MPI-PUGE-AT-0066]
MYFAGLSLLVSLAAFTAAGLVPRTSPVPCSPRYICPECDTNNIAQNNRRSTSGALTAKYPNYISCPSIAKPNPECTYTRRTEPLPQRAANPAALLADGVSLARFARHPSPTADE